MQLVRQHPQLGYEILKDGGFPWPVAEIALQHHERVDGSGYPQGLAGDQIPLSSRIVAVADVVEAMASFRPYRAALGIDAAMDEIRGNPDRYGSDVVTACLDAHAAGRFTL
jgi:HD-GYP domain-containing protein (c-di-GMP phosphodiesterase class II)